MKLWYMHVRICIHTRRKQKMASIKALLAAGADVLMRDADGRTPLHVAVEEGLYEVCIYVCFFVFILRVFLCLYVYMFECGCQGGFI
jgi:hypothetical protein